MAFQKGKSGNEATQFKSGQTGNPNGRPVKLFSEISADWQRRGIQRATPERVIEIFEYLLALPDAELKEMKSGENYPSIVQMAADEMTGKRKREILNDMLDRAHGKATQKQEITGKDGGAIEFSDTSALTVEEKRALLKLTKARGNVSTDTKHNAAGTSGD